MVENQKVPEKSQKKTLGIQGVEGSRDRNNNR